MAAALGNIASYGVTKSYSNSFGIIYEVMVLYSFCLILKKINLSLRLCYKIGSFSKVFLHSYVT